MYIFDLMDCQDCRNAKEHKARTQGDPDQCYPGGIVCKQDAPDSGLCDRMVGVIRDYINDGCLSTEYGQFFTGEYLQDWQWDDGQPAEFKWYDFSSATYYWVPDNLDTGKILAYADEKAVYEDWFI
jgi:hypothetical protein